MEYTKPVVLAQNSKEQSFAAGCPTESKNVTNDCRRCEISS